jgi:hypothetical protein
MTTLITWLLGASTVPTGIVWAGGGVGAAVTLAVLLLTMISALAWQRDRMNGASLQARCEAEGPSEMDSRLPSAA